MTYNETLWFIVNPEYISYMVDNGIVMMSTSPEPLDYAPDSWREINISVAKNNKYWALDRSFTIPVKFVEDGATIIKNRAYTYGTEDKLILVILRQKMFFDATHYGVYFDHLYKGELDISQMKHSGPTVTVNIMEGGIPKHIKANENVKYEFPMNVPEAKLVKMDGVKLQSTQRYDLLLSPVILSPNRKQIVPFLKTQGEGYFFNLLFKDQIGVIPDSAANEITGENLAASEKYITVASADGAEVSITVTGGIQRTGSGPGGSMIGQEWKAETSLGQVISIGIINQPVTTPITFSFTSPVFTLAKDEKVFVYVTTLPVGGNAFWKWTDETRLNIQTKDRKETSYVRYFTLSYLFEQICLKVTEGQHHSESTLFSNLAARFGPNIEEVWVTCGDALRGFDEAILKTSLSDFFTSVNAWACIGMGAIQDKIRMETKDFWVNYSNPIVVGNAPTPTYSWATEYFYNTMKFGYPHRDIEGVNGRYTFNDTHLYSTPYTRQQKEYNAVSVYLADPYVMEAARVNFEGKKTTDSSTDSEVFFACVRSAPITETINGTDTPVYLLDRRLNAYITAGSHPEPETIFNLPLTPKQNLYRHERFIHSFFYKMDHKKLTLENIDKWRDLEVKAPGQRVITEKSHVEIGELGSPLFAPLLIDVEVESPVDLIDTLELSPMKSVMYSDNGLALSGLIVKAGIEPSTNETQNYQLLSAPNNPIESLIDIYE